MSWSFGSNYWVFCSYSAVSHSYLTVLFALNEYVIVLIFPPNFPLPNLFSGRCSAMWPFGPLFIDDRLQVHVVLISFLTEHAINNIFVSLPFFRVSRVYLNNLSKEKKFGKRCLMMIPIRTFNLLFSETRDTSKPICVPKWTENWGHRNSQCSFSSQILIIHGHSRQLMISIND